MTAFNTPMNPEELRRTKEIMSKASERLIQRGWATQSIDSNKGLGIRLTSQGSEGLEDLYAALQSLDPSTLEQDHMVGIVLHAIARHQAREGL